MMSCRSRRRPCRQEATVADAGMKRVVDAGSVDGTLAMSSTFLTFEPIPSMHRTTATRFTELHPPGGRIGRFVSWDGSAGPAWADCADDFCRYVAPEKSRLTEALSVAPTVPCLHKAGRA